MKKILIMLSIIIASTEITNAQTVTEVVAETAEETTTSTSSTATGYGTISLGYVAYNDDLGWGYEYLIARDNFIFGYGHFFGVTNDYLTSNSSGLIDLGYIKHYNLAEMLFIEGSIGITGDIHSYKIKGEDDETKFTVGAFFYPRIGINLIKGFGVNVGYKYRMSKFDPDLGYDAFVFALHYNF